MGALTIYNATDQKNSSTSSASSDHTSLPLFTFKFPYIEQLFQRSVVANVVTDYTQHIIASNVDGQIGKARIIYLLQPHKNNAFQRIFYKTLIEQLYQPGDRVLLERDSSAKIGESEIKFSTNLDPAKYSFAGWDAPGPIAKFKKEGKFWTHKEIEAFVNSTWKVRQASLIACTKKGLSRIFNNRVFVIMGNNHGVNNDPEKSPQAIDFLPTLGYPWAILDPLKKPVARL